MEISEHEACQLVSIASARYPLKIFYGNRIYLSDSATNCWAEQLVKDWRQEHSYGRGE